MPFTPYHFGPSGFLGLALRKWLDFPVFVLANVVVDIEVLLFHHWPMHRYSHTLLIGAVVGAVWGIAAYPLRHFFEKIMQLLRIPYQTGFWKMVVSGVLGVWLHVVTDAIYHWDVRIFWPSKAKPLYGLISQGWVKAICVAFFFAALILYTIVALSTPKGNQNIRKNQN
ncbi:MAG: hypothetical protein ABSG99_06870 [Sedimentisphaerales bacterium]